MFHKIFIEDEIKNHQRTLKILQGLSSQKTPITTIERIDDVFGKAKKPYLQKRSTLNLFIGKKRGTLVKEAPAAYGLAGDPHYYFIHAFNCLYECEYCYLQGYFSSPDLVVFINHEEIGEEITRIVKMTPLHQTPWFHAGEFSDSLALSHLTQEWPYYFDLFRHLPQARLELRTKSANIKTLLQLTPLPNIITSFSLSPERQSTKFDHKASPLKARLSAIQKLGQKGHPLAIHLDPIIYYDNFSQDYEQLLQQLIAVLPAGQIDYISLGVVRFTKEVFSQVEKNYPSSELLGAEFIKSFDNKVRYGRPLRLWILQTLQKLCQNVGISPEKIYLCMEKNESHES